MLIQDLVAFCYKTRNHGTCMEVGMLAYSHFALAVKIIIKLVPVCLSTNFQVHNN